MSQPDGRQRFFPYERTYPNQGAAMERIAEALREGRDVLFEGAPGTGKTLSALAPALEFARETDRTVVITTNVHQQMRQFVEEARAIDAGEPIRAVVFKGKASMCHIDVDYQECQTLRDTTRDLVEAASDRDELERRERELLEASRAEGGGAGTDAAEARQAIMDELESVEDDLEELRDAAVCQHYHRNLTADTDEFFRWLHEGVRTPEEIYAYADREGLCGYELLKEGLEAVDLVVCNYHHLLDPGIREQFFRWLGRDPEQVVTVFDEAHNIESAARDHATRTLTENTLDAALGELEDVEDSRVAAAENVLGAFRDALVETCEENLGFGGRENVGEHWEDVAVANDDARDDLTLAFLHEYEGRGIDTEVELAIQLGRRLDEDFEDAYRRGETSTRKECRTLQAAEFVAAWMAESTDLGQHPMVGVRRDSGTGEVYGRAELYTCIPSQVTRDLFDEVAASVLMSATLRPFDVTADVLGLDDPATMAYGLTFPPDRRRTYAVDTPPLFAGDRDDPAVQRVVGDTLSDIIRLTPGNTLLFFPSYAEAERYHGRLGGTSEGGGHAGDGTLASFENADLGELLLDGPGVDTEELRRRFVGSDDGALFTSLWGTLAEGVSFDGDDARTVAVVGVPYPHLSDRMEAVQDAYEATYRDRADAGWRYAVEIPTVRKTRQALGRVIRAPDDYGVRLLLDRRYTTADMGRYSVRETFPEEERAELVDVAPGKLKFAMQNFFADLDAYEGDPPQP